MIKKRKKWAKIALFCSFLIIFLSACSPKPAAPENTDYFVLDGAIYKLEPELKTEQVELAAKKISAQIAAHPEAGNIYLSVIPDKSYFVAEKNGYAAMDYNAMVEQIRSSVPDAQHPDVQYIDIFDTLSVEDYYATDHHWRQEKLLPTAQALCYAMGAAAPEESDFEATLVGDFKGVLVGLSGFEAEADQLYIMESEATKNAAVTSAEAEGTLPVYAPEKLTGKEPYDVYLHGAQAVLTIENPNAETERELVIFRDSFGSSLAPLLIGSYSKITLIDLRYIMSDFVPEYADFDGADVLFIYSTTLLNSGGILR